MADTKETEEKKSGGGKKLLLIGVVSLVVLVAGAFALVEFVIGAEKDAVAEDGSVADAEASWSQESHEIPLLFVNLAKTQGKRYLKLGCTIEFSAKNPAAEIERFTEDATSIKDGLITLLSGKTLDDIDGSEKKRAMKEEIRKVLTRILFPEPEQGRVDTVYYYEFLVQ